MKIISATTKNTSRQYLSAGDWFRDPKKDYKFKQVGRNDGEQIVLTNFTVITLTEDNRWDSMEVLVLETED